MKPPLAALCVLLTLWGPSSDAQVGQRPVVRDESSANTPQTNPRPAQPASPGLGVGVRADTVVPNSGPLRVSESCGRELDAFFAAKRAYNPLTGRPGAPVDEPSIIEGFNQSVRNTAPLNCEPASRQKWDEIVAAQRVKTERVRQSDPNYFADEQAMLCGYVTAQQHLASMCGSRTQTATAAPASQASPAPNANTAPAVAPAPVPQGYYADVWRKDPQLARIEQLKAQCGEERRRAVEAERERTQAARRHDASLVANECLRPDESPAGYGGFINKCPVKVEFMFCTYRPKKGAWSEAFDCMKPMGPQQQYGLDQVGEMGRSAQHTKNAQKIYWAACRAPEASPMDVTFEEGLGLRYRCHRWGSGSAGGTTQPPATPACQALQQARR